MIKIKGILVVFFPIFLSACMSDVAEYRALAEHGSALSNELVSEARSVRTALNDARAYNDFRKRLAGGQTGEANEWNDVSKSVSLRLAAAKNLQATYKAFAALADYDASGEFGKAANGLMTSINGLPIKPKSGGPIISEPVQKLVEMAASKIADAEQSRRLKIASEGMVPLLIEYHKYLGDEAEANVALLRRGAHAKFELTRYACAHYPVSAQVFEARLPLAAGLRFAAGTVGCSSKTPAMTQAILGLLDDQRDQTDAQIKDAYDQETEALGELIQVHKNLLEDRPASLSSLRTALAELTAIIDQLNKLLAEPPAKPAA